VLLFGRLFVRLRPYWWGSLIAVLLDSPDTYRDATRLLDLGFRL